MKATVATPIIRMMTSIVSSLVPDIHLRVLDHQRFKTVDLVPKIINKPV